MAQRLGAAPNVVSVSVERVDLPRAPTGTCVVNGRVSEVYAGDAFRQGQAIQIAVPCGRQVSLRENRPGPRFDSSAAEGSLDMRVLAASKLGLATLDDRGRLVWGAAPVMGRTPPGEGGIVWPGGYRVLDGMVLPLGKAETL